MEGRPARCLECDTEVAGAFCSSCGQRATTGRLETVPLLRQAADSLVGWDSRLPRTIRDLTVRPGTAALDYVTGRRRRYVAPAQYCLLGFAVLLVVMALRDVRPSDFAPQPIAVGTPETQAIAAEVGRLADRHLQAFTIAAIPFLALAAAALNRRSGRNFAESCALFLYLIGHGTLVGSLPRAVVGAGTGTSNAVIGAVSIAYYTWGVRGFYAASWPRALASFVLGYLLWILAVMVAMVVSVVIAVILARA